MEKVESLGEVSIWADLNRDILELIFNKLDVMDITMGASRVCISWFLASHNRTLWNTVDLTKLQEFDISHSFDFKNKKPRPILFYKHPVDDKGHMNPLVKIISSFFGFFEEEGGGRSLRNLLIEITKLSRMAPKNLFFNFNSNIYESSLKLAAKRMPHIEKLALSFWCYQTESSYRFAFSQWKNLKTLIIAHDKHSHTGEFEFKAVGESCSNLTNLKYLGYLQDNTAMKIVHYFQSLKRLSLRCSTIIITAVLSLITGLQNLKILNLSHCKDFRYHHITIFRNDFVQAANQKLEHLITCSQDCRICKDHCRYSWSYLSEDWRNDEIKELEF